MFKLKKKNNKKELPKQPKLKSVKFILLQDERKINGGNYERVNSWIYNQHDKPQHG